VVRHEPDFVEVAAVAAVGAGLPGSEHRPVGLATDVPDPQAIEVGHSEHHLHMPGQLEVGEDRFQLLYTECGDGHGDGLKAAVAAVPHGDGGGVEARGMALHDLVDMLLEGCAGLPHHLDGVVAGEFDPLGFGFSHCGVATSGQAKRLMKNSMMASHRRLKRPASGTASAATRGISLSSLSSNLTRAVPSCCPFSIGALSTGSSSISVVSDSFEPRGMVAWTSSGAARFR